MDNIKASKTAEGKLLLEIDPSVELGDSKTGKTIMIATTHGGVPLGDTGIVVSVNIYRVKPKADKKPKGKITF